ncbi:MAG: DUF559 domain-containing protein [Gallionella sp.]
MDAEIRLWQRLRSRQLAGCKFRRQHPYLDYVLDFVCLERSLIAGNTWKTSAIKHETGVYSKQDFGCCDSGTTRFCKKRMQW